MNREEVTRTIYDELGSIAATVRSSQGGALIEVPVNTLFGSDYAYDNTRNRIVGVIYQEDYNQSTNVYESATFYDYDVHGNVNRVIYQRDREDQFMHRYAYDSDNRITIAETSKDGILWEKDAKYFYYEHGPLARTEIGDSKVQASDYAYTIQGWLKAVNGEEVDPTSMMGNDGSQGTLNSQGARDVSGFSLSYYNGDYAAANDAMLNHTPVSNTIGASLYNGNIRTMVTALVDVNEVALASHQTNYEYDQLNRIKSMDGLNREVGQTEQASGYSSTYSFYPNGNLKTLTRTAVDDQGSVKVMDDFVYHYDELVNGGDNNQLSWVEDNANSAGGFVSEFDDADIDGSMVAGNYEYDAIGQLILDEDEGILNILWKVTNKVEEIHIDTDGDEAADKIIHFDYDPMGNRIAKHVTGVSEPKPMSTYYVLDAQGNVMSTYQYDINGQELKLQERNLYGSSRVGVENVYEVLDYIDYDQTIQLANDYSYLSYNGDKSFELSNHLGNVLQVITERKLPTEGTGLLTDKVDYYTADVIAYTDYYPYGMQMPERNGTSGNGYRYGYNGMERDDEVKGNKNSYNFTARFYDPRIGRWMSRDPHEGGYPDQSPYHYALNSPLVFNDPNGKDAIVTIDQNDPSGFKTITMTSTIYMAGDRVNKEFVDEMNEAFKHNFGGDDFMVVINGEMVKLKFEVEYVDLMSIDPSIATPEQKALQDYMNKREAGNAGNTPAIAKGDGLGLQRGNNMVILDKSGMVSSTDRGKSQTVLSTVEIDKDTGKIKKTKSDEHLQYHALHETLHLFGLSDRYNVTQNADGSRTTENHPGFDYDWMGYGTEEKYSNLMSGFGQGAIPLGEVHVENLLKAVMDIFSNPTRYTKDGVTTTFEYNKGRFLDSDDPNRQKANILGHEH